MEGVIVGKALYAGAFTLPEALAAVAEARRAAGTEPVRQNGRVPVASGSFPAWTSTTAGWSRA